MIALILLLPILLFLLSIAYTDKQARKLQREIKWLRNRVKLPDDLWLIENSRDT